MDVWILLVGRSTYKLNNRLTGFDFASVFSSFETLEATVLKDEKLTQLHWVKYNDRFITEYRVAEYERMVFSQPTKYAVIAIPFPVDYHAIKPRTERLLNE